MTRLRAYSIEIILVLVLAGAVAFFGYLGYGLLPSNNFDGNRALINAQAQVGFGPRVTGTEGSVRASDALTRELTALGWDVAIQPITLTNQVVARNIIAMRKSTKRNAPVAIVGAHYDSRAAADADNDPASRTLQTPGAVDNAAGVGILLELARTLDVNQTGHDVCLVFFDADDNARLPGWSQLIGSTNFVQALKEPRFPCRAPRFAVLVETVGYSSPKLYIDNSSHLGLSTAIWQTAAKLGYGSTLVDRTRDAVIGEHTVFLEAGIPATILTSTDYAYQHTMRDTADKLNADSLAMVGNTLETWLENGATFASR